MFHLLIESNGSKRSEEFDTFYDAQERAIKLIKHKTRPFDVRFAVVQVYEDYDEPEDEIVIETPRRSSRVRTPAVHKDAELKKAMREHQASTGIHGGFVANSKYHHHQRYDGEDDESSRSYESDDLISGSYESDDLISESYESE